jgi:Zn ribbon nucleic-acid-binding protein
LTGWGLSDRTRIDRINMKRVMRAELFQEAYKPVEGPLFVKLELNEGGGVSVSIYVKYRDAHNSHNHFLDVALGCVEERKRMIEKSLCPCCATKMWFGKEDEFTLTFCDMCGYTAWSDRIVFEDAYSDYYCDDFY